MCLHFNINEFHCHLKRIRKIRRHWRIFSKARVVGIEPTLEVLETPVLPLYYTRKLT
jgi:hypothetical protein